MIKFRLWQRLAVVPHHCNAYARDLLIVECTVQWHYCPPPPPCYSGPSSCTVATPRTARDVDVAAHRVHSAPYAGMPAARTVLRPTPGPAATSPHEAPSEIEGPTPGIRISNIWRMRARRRGPSQIQTRIGHRGVGRS